MQKVKLVIVLSLFTHFAFSQTADSAKSVRYFGGGVTVTNNGISLLPTFSLNKPAAIFDLVAGTKRLSFEPQFRFALDGKPWSFIFWWRYKVVNSNRFKLNVGMHPSILFHTVVDNSSGSNQETIVGQRFLAGEFAPNYYVAKNISIGLYFLTGHGFDPGATHYTQFVTFNANFSNIKLWEQFYMKFFPQVYYLWMDQIDGYYVTATVTLARKNFPLSVQSILNKPISTHIQAGNEFVWNISLAYSVKKEYVRKP